MIKHCYVIFCAALLLLALLFRYSTVSGGNGAVYVLDRWTGAMDFVIAEKRIRIQKSIAN